MDIKFRVKNIYFWLGLIGVVFSAAGLDFNTMTNWQLLMEGLISIISNPVAIVSVIAAIVGVCVDTSTPGFKDKDKVE